MNLVSNSTKSFVRQKPGQQACIHIAFNIMKIEVNRVRVKLSINDNGDGIKKEILDDIYAPFLMGDSADNVKGNGLGMTIVKHILDSMDADIHIDSEIKKVTSTTITFECDGADEWYGKKKNIIIFLKESRMDSWMN